jgi:hypothetical protein
MLDLEGYDAVIIAIGPIPGPQEHSGISRPNVLWASDAETKYRSKVGKKVVVIGAGDVAWKPPTISPRTEGNHRLIDMMPKPVF